MKTVGGIDYVESVDDTNRPLRHVLIWIFFSFITTLWTAWRFGGLCSQLPVYVTLFFFFAALISLFIVTNKPILFIPIFVVAIGSTLLCARIAGHAKRALDVARIGIDVGVSDAAVTEAIPYWVSRNRYYHTTDGGYRGCQIEFTYVVDGKQYKQCDVVAKTDIVVGEHVRILYSLVRPQIARMLRPNETLAQDLGR